MMMPNHGHKVNIYPFVGTKVKNSNGHLVVSAPIDFDKNVTVVITHSGLLIKKKSAKLRIFSMS